MVLMSRNGAEGQQHQLFPVRILELCAAFFVFLGSAARPPGGGRGQARHINNVHFTDILCSSDNTTSNKWGSNITGQIYNGTTYSISNLFFTNCNITFKGGDNSIPGNPPEWDSNQYPEVSMWGDLPAYGYYMRHVNASRLQIVLPVSMADARPEKATSDVSNFTTRVDTDGDGMPDDWEQQYFGSTTAGSATADDDGDGMTNYAEFRGRDQSKGCDR